MTCNIKYDLMVQFIGLIAFYFLVSSNFKKSKKRIIASQMIANFFFSVHYLFLDAYSGALTSFVIMIRNLCFYEIKKPKYLAIPFCLIFIILGIFTFKEWYSILPIIGACILTLSATKTKKVLIKGGIVNASCWLVFNIFSKSYAGMLTESVFIVTSVIALTKIKRKIPKKD